MADYLIKELPGQTIITSHSPQIAARYKPNSIVRITSKSGNSYAANNGCSDCISTAWDNLGYRMSILPAEAFFSHCVFLVEGPSEQLFYQELAYSSGIDLDYFNISILCVDGVQFDVYGKILDALEIPWVMRTDNDVSKVPYKDLKNLAGINRCLNIKGLAPYPHYTIQTTPQSLVQNGVWANVSNIINPLGLYLSQVDLEHDIALELPHELLGYANTTDISVAISYLQAQKAIRMREFLVLHKNQLKNISTGLLIQPLIHAKRIAEGVK